ncbi:transmembrane emp24 domain-containing protein eca-like [Convolutriloba macropyga]|uniref:transmembrane emp24 domain-containing protein eca-like n=1 Tax=Convolutriloba macropyga TaxID=536237 RepID=UPI003F51BA73
MAMTLFFRDSSALMAGLTKWLAILAVVCVMLPKESESLYFHISETERKCFIEEVPDETLVKGNYKTMIQSQQSDQFLPPSQGIGMHVDVRDPNDKMVLSRTYSAQGQFTFISHTAGEHVICLYSNTSKWFGGAKLRVYLDIQVGEHANNYQEIASKDKLSELQLRLRQLNDQVQQIQKEQNYQRQREKRFRDTSESTSQRVVVWAMFQLVILVGLGFWQVQHLKKFFIAKKLV